MTQFKCVVGPMLAHMTAMTESRLTHNISLVSHPMHLTHMLVVVHESS